MAQNTSTITFSDGRIICLSYGVPVAAFVPGQGYVRTARRYSVTTSKHMNAFAGRTAPELDDVAFASVVSPLEVK